jgi:CubicO group peptidase (beta-lactamase class C family)
MLSRRWFLMPLFAALTVSIIGVAGAAPIPGPTPRVLVPAGESMHAINERAFGSPAVDDIDKDVFAVMKASDVHGASLAIIVDAHLVYAKGYAWGGGKIPVVRPTTLFRQASVSKLITALATMQLINEGKLHLNTTMQSVLRLKAPGGRTPADRRFDDITIQDLLEMRSGLDPNLPDMDATIAQALHKQLPITRGDIGEYAAGEKLISAPGDRSQAFYNNSDYMFLGYIVAKMRDASSFVAAIQKPMLRPLSITRIRAARALFDDQSPDEARYYPNPYQTAQSVMSPDQPTVELGYGELNFGNDEGAGGLSAAATDIARVLAAMNLEQGNPAFKSGMVTDMFARAYKAFQDPRFTHKDSMGNSDAFGFYGLDTLEPVPGTGHVPPYQGDKGGYISTSQNAVFFQSGGIGYVICWNGHTLGGESWYPVFNSVLKAAMAHDWGKTDLFPQYGMPSFIQTRVYIPLKYPGELINRPTPRP